MATYKMGDRSDEVKKIQRVLGIQDDGIYGSQTRNAVEEWQRNNNLKVDGIVGNQTWGSMFTPAQVEIYPQNTQNTTSWGNQYSSRPTYTPSQSLNDAAAKLAEYENNKPGAYQSKYQDQISGLLDKILNREKFTYDAMSDPLYQQYKESYTQQGKLAMQDAMGSAAALTGGYGSSYGQTVGQQVYQQNLQQLNDKIPELYSAAYGRYADEGNTMTQNLGILQGLDESDYGRYRDDVGDYYNELQYFYTKYNDMSNQELQRYMADQDAWESDRAYWYQREQDAQDQSNWQAEFDLARQKAASSGTSKSSTSTERDTMDLSEAMKAVGQYAAINGSDAALAMAKEIMQTGMVETSENRSMSVIKKMLEEAATLGGRY